ncbi:hypothetical protein ACI2UK_13725 [Ralstonia nicotianae]|uniref:hypothetical protein n=1 Tax=Ralstonia pseudosolanacearum TaxID=1310165 RepID=UPI00200666F7|nr:hypothetical protein [Ralstonia pseudosolanacearum]MCK4118396.1 hypothetical protein [Ralstonia pseudosolanacearum]
MLKNTIRVGVILPLMSCCLAASGGAAAQTKSVAERLIDGDATIALQKMQQQIDRTALAAVVSAAPAAGEPRRGAADSGPKTLALYGVDGSAAGLPVSLRTYVRWGDEVYAAKVGAKWRGYTVTGISEEGTTLAHGRRKLFAPLNKNDAGVFETPVATKPAAAVLQPAPMAGQPTMQPAFAMPQGMATAPAAQMPVNPAAPVASR